MNSVKVIYSFWAQRLLRNIFTLFAASLVKIAFIALFSVAFCLTVAAQTTNLEWQNEAIRRYPALGVLGSPLNKKFVSEYQRRKDLPSEANFFANSQWPVLLADQCAKDLSSVSPVTPAPALVKPDSEAKENHTAPGILFFIFAGLGLLVFVWLISRETKPATDVPVNDESVPGAPTSRGGRRANRPSNNISCSGLLAAMGLVAGLVYVVFLIATPETPYKKGYILGESAGRDFVESGGSMHVSVDQGIIAYSISDRLEVDPEIRRGYRDGFNNAYDRALAAKFYRR